MALTEYIEFDTTPVNEDCVGLNPKDPDNYVKMKEEAMRFRNLLEEKFPNVPGVFMIKSVGHDFGTYLEIRYYFDDNEEGWLSSNFVENNLPLTWEDKEPLDFLFYKVFSE